MQNHHKGLQKESDSATISPPPKQTKNPTLTKHIQPSTQTEHTHAPNQTLFMNNNHRFRQDFSENRYSIVEVALTMAIPL